MTNIRYSGIAVLLLTIAGCADITDDGEAEHATSADELSAVASDSPPDPATNIVLPKCSFLAGKWRCENRAPALLFTTRSQSSHALDTMRSTISIFRCKAEGGFSGGGVHPNRWACTQGDDQKKFGWMRDIDIASETDPLPDCKGSDLCK